MTRETVRAYLRLPVEVVTPQGTFHGRTRDLSRGGALLFMEPPYPQGSATLKLDLPDGPVELSAEVRFTIPNVGVGFQFVDLPPDALARVEQAVDAAASTVGLWGLVGKYLNHTDKRTPPLRLPPTSSESLFAELRATLKGGGGPRAAAQAPGQHVLHPVGENGAAYSVLFRRAGCVPPVESPLAAMLPGFVRTVSGRAMRVAPQDVWLKLHTGSQPKPYRVVQLAGGGFAAVVVSQVPGSPPKVSLLTLAFGEQVAISERGASLFPHFTEPELEEIRRDSIRDGHAGEGGGGEGPRAALSAGGTRFTDYAPFDDANEAALTGILERDTQSEIRNYGTRTVTLHPHVLLRIRDANGNEDVGVPLHDGKRHCLLQLVQEGFGRVIPLTRNMQMSVMIR